MSLGFRVRLGRDERAQMLLLTSIILLIGFFALSGMVIRVAQLPEETVQESRRPIDLEADAVARGVLDAATRVEERVPPDSNAGANEDFKAALADTLQSVSELEQGRGFRFSLLPDDGTGDELNCQVTANLDGMGYGEIRVWFTFALEDLDTRIQVTTEAYFGTDQVGDPVEDRRRCWA